MHKQRYQSLYGALRDTALKYPRHTALDYCGIRTTFKQLLHEIDRLGAVWEKNGVKSGDRVLICLPNIPLAVTAFYSLNKMGVVPCIAHPSSKASEIIYFIKNTQSRLLLTLDIFYANFEDSLANSGIEKTIIARSDKKLSLMSIFNYFKQEGKEPRPKRKDNILFWNKFKTGKGRWYNKKPFIFKADQPALLLFSRDTTAKPKGVLLSNKNMNALAEQFLAQVKLNPITDAMLCMIPFSHGFGLSLGLHSILLGGGCCILVPSFSPKDFIHAVVKKKPSYIAGPPSFFQAFINNKKLQKINLSFIKGAFCSSGDITPPGLIKRFNRFMLQGGSTASLREGYGLTECVSICSIMPRGIYKEGSVGLPFSGTSIKIVDPETMEELPPETRGEICVKGPAVMLGYNQQERETTRALQVHGDGTVWLHTGDTGYLDKEGFLFPG